MEGLVYLDNNSATLAPAEVVDTVARWMGRGSPAAGHAAAREARKMVRGFRRFLAAEGGFELEGPRGYAVVFTSGGSEGNCHVLTSAARAFAARTGRLPHIVTSAVEHASVLACCRGLVRDRAAQLTVLPVRRAGGRAGTVDVAELRAALRPNTCLVSIMAANHETGALNDLRALAAAARAARVPFHSDAVQLFGKSSVRPADLGLAAFTAAFHKAYGPPGAGVLVLRNDFVAGYGLAPLVCGPQNGGLRGGAVNVPALAGAFAACRLAAAGRGAKNRKTRRLRDRIKAALAGRFLAVHADAYGAARPRVPDRDPLTPASSRVPGAPRTREGAALARRLDAAAERDAPVVVWLGPADPAKALPNTLLLSVLRPGGFCGERARAALERRKVLVGAGSPHVAAAMDVPPELWAGVLRVSLCDSTSLRDVEAFVAHFAAVAVSADVLLEQN